jgi:uncharacterized membrane protein
MVRLNNMTGEALLFLHLAGAFVFVGGSLAAALLRVAALRSDDSRTIAVLLRAVRPVVPIVGGGLVVAVGFGAWLAHRDGYAFGSSWLSATFGLLGWMLVVGGFAGRQDRHTRELAERLATTGGDSTELRARLRDPLNLVLNGSMLAATVAVVALMVWKP